MRRQNENEKIEGNVFKRKMILSGLINSIFDGKDITENHAKHEKNQVKLLRAQGGCPGTERR